MRRRPRSLSLQLTLAATAWCLIVLAAAALALTSLYRQTAMSAFERELDLYVLNLIAVADLSDDMETVGSADLGNPRFGTFASGWFWQIAEVDASTSILQSSSLGGRFVEMPSAVDIPYDADFSRSYTVEPVDEPGSQVVERIILFEDRDQPISFAVGGALSEVADQATAFFRLLSIALAVVGIGLVVAMALVIRLGLRPLRAMREQLTQIREGARERLDDRYPDELEPLAAELNTLFESNNRIIERARTQAGNLAHALKTPLAVLQNESDRVPAVPGKLVRDQVVSMREQVDYHLNRARIAATTSARSRHPIDKSLQAISRTLAQIQREKSIKVSHVGDDGLEFRGEAEDFDEIVGNLLENAFKWGTSEIRISREKPENTIEKKLRVTIEDDGPGVSEDNLGRIVERGRRLDEATPGTGLGLSIVDELVGLYGGALGFSRSDLGGLKVQVELPAAETR